MSSSALPITSWHSWIIGPTYLRTALLSTGTSSFSRCHISKRFQRDIPSITIP